MKKLMLILTMIILTSCKNSIPTDSFCLVYVKPTIKDGEVAKMLFTKEPDFVEDSNKNKKYYFENCK